MARRFIAFRLFALVFALLCVSARAGEITAYTALEEDDISVYLDGLQQGKTRHQGQRAAPVDRRSRRAHARGEGQPAARRDLGLWR